MHWNIQQVKQDTVHISTYTESEGEGKTLHTQPSCCVQWGALGPSDTSFVCPFVHSNNYLLSICFRKGVVEDQKGSPLSTDKKKQVSS